MLDSVLGAGGILVSVLLFAFGYRQTVGAKKERIRLANIDVEKIVVRRIILEGYTPTTSDISRLLQGKARDFRVADNDLFSEEQLLNTVYTRIVESDLIPTDQREQILQRIVPALIEAEANPIDESQDRGTPASSLLGSTSRRLGFIAGVASVVGAIVSIIPELSSATLNLRDIVVPALATLTASLIVLGVLIAFHRLRTSQEAVTTKADAIHRYIAFEAEVSRMLKKLGVRSRPTTSNEPGDFVLDMPDGRILVEVKSWKSMMPKMIIVQLAERLTEAIQRSRAAEAIVVTPEPVRYPPAILADKSVKLMTLPELRTYLGERMTKPRPGT
ncbi:MAG TPA: hypothetical protein VJU84_00695 [Pyrinomonadaceae bacterium]|nr:hypothetical protein [Pyrinomonadaceae bacterium]